VSALNRDFGDPRVARAMLAPESWFQTLPRALQLELAWRVQPRYLRAGERLCARGELSDGFYGLSDGILRIGSTSGGGEALLAMVQPPHWFGELGLFDGATRTHDVHAETDVVLLHLSQAVMLAVLEHEPEGWRHLGRLLAGKMRSVFVSFEQMQMLPPRARVARRLVMMAADHQVDRPTLRRELALSQEQLARMLSLSRQTVNEVLAGLEADGLIQRRRRVIELLDPDRLRQDGASPGESVEEVMSDSVDKSVDKL
jgi:CRP-like cAMP-binding protein